MLDINAGELLIIAVIAVVLIGPERLPQYVQQLATFARTAKGWFTEVKDRVADELGPEVSDVDWSRLDPRKYDPRSIVRDALLDDLLPGGVRRPAGSVEDVVERRPQGAVALSDDGPGGAGPAPVGVDERRTEVA
ncbi:twin-arginine translocation protein, TatB subunit [Xylanimonas cellulosilytica DSM 15894]|uniref:Twin-arginine translocation protein, TatB subunit n=1 Tax=Xylanimonas cellulosilytica (strain DSM 15894 / JCM 12276 / CECT 5975 / KCTC 9989 / LMG 20990 / NBRC 107835 / XIL07) TaxID=446471 RepID=D1BTU7_XYLCX|nr:twin-arginine translocation protein, TatB subunit [Xylanimonas cellulosilytica]ACZ29111.1 twin-arginine translocation protein, TatB subunit [Xylanimonas cellulosilytica DSM 15894]